MERGTICLSVRNSQSVAQRERDKGLVRSVSLGLGIQEPKTQTENWVPKTHHLTAYALGANHRSPCQSRQAGWVGFSSPMQDLLTKGRLHTRANRFKSWSLLSLPTEISCVFTHLAIPKCVNKRLLCNQSLILVSSLLQIFKGFFKSVVDLFGVNEMLLEKIHMEEWATLVRRQIRHFLRLR